MATSRPVALDLHEVEPTTPWETVSKVQRLISPKVGLLKRISNTIHLAQDPLALSMGVTPSDLSNFSSIVNAPKAGGGGESWEMALAATVGEAVERYCMLFYDKSEMVFAPYREVAESAVSPDLLRLYSRRQVEASGENVRLDYFDDDTRIRWVWAHSLTDGRPRLVPATLVYLQYVLEDDEQAPGRNASSGLAAGATLEEAILSGLLEVVERDAFTMAWLHRRVAARIEVDDEEVEEMLRVRFHTGHPLVDFRFFDITLDIPLPSVFAVMRRPSDFGPVLCVSSVTRTSPRQAMLKALREVGQGLPYMRYLNQQLRDWTPAPDFSDLVSFDHHCSLYVKRPELVAPALAFVDQVAEVRPLSQLPDPSTGSVVDDIRHCVRSIEEAGYEVLVVDITTPDIEDLGLKVVRVLVPGLLPLHGNHNYPYLGVRRLYELPKTLGWCRGGDHDGLQLNPFPHPFP